MIPILVSGPAVEPVSIAEMRAWLRLDPDAASAAEDALLAHLARAARLTVEAHARVCLIGQTWRLVLDRWPLSRRVRLPLAPALSLVGVALADAAGVAAPLDPALARLDARCDPPLLVVDPAAPQPGAAHSGIAIEARFGFGESAEAVPAPLAQAMRLLVARWFDNRGDAAALGVVPAEAEALIAAHRRLAL